MFLKRIGDFARRACQLEATLPVLVGVSGGADSLSLLDGLHSLGYPVIAAHFNHQLRPETENEALLVGKICHDLGVAAVFGSQLVARLAKEERLSVEDAARKARYRFLFSQARQHGVQAVAVGHTADDQVETILLHLLQGSGPSGLKGMRPRSVNLDWDAKIPLVRPLLEISHADTLAYCREKGWQPFEDPSNADPHFLRNRIRSELIPVLETYNPQARAALQRLAAVVEGEDAFIEGETDLAWQPCIQSSVGGRVVIRRGEYARQPLALRRRLLKRAVKTLLPDGRELGFELIERAMGFIDHPQHTGPVDLTGGICLRVEHQQIVVGEWTDTAWSSDCPQLNPGLSFPLGLPGQVPLAGAWRLEATPVDDLPSGLLLALANTDSYQAWLDAARLKLPLEVRGWRRGDRFQPLGLGGHSQKLSDFFTNARLPARLRGGWPLVCSAGEVIWVPGFRQAEKTRLTEETRQAVYLQCVWGKRDEDRI